MNASRMKQHASGSDTPMSGRGRRGRRRARKAAALGMTAAVAVPQARRGARWFRRLARLGLMAAVAAAAVKWALGQRATRDAYLEGPTDVPAGNASTGLAASLPTRETATSGTVGSPAGGTRTTDDLIDLSTAAEVLQVEESRIEVMVAEGLLTPVGAGAGSPRFHEAEVQSVRLLGG
jgi:hypothetical protein